MTREFDKVTKVAFTRFNEELLRMVAYEKCPDTGAMSVYDVVEIHDNRPDSNLWVAQMAADYTERSDTEVEYVVHKDCKEFPAAEVTDFGRVRTMKSKMRKVLEQI